MGAAALSVLAHASILPTLILGQPPAAPMVVEIAPTTVMLVRELPPVPTPPAPVEAKAPAPTPKRAAAPAAPTRVVARKSVAPVAPDPLPAASARSAQSAGADASLTDAQLAGATVAGSGTAGGECDMARRLQSALRRDPLVQAAVARAGAGASAHHAILVWDGDWVRDDSEDGKGLAAVREAMMWEIAFAPQACRAEPVRGLVLLSLNEAPGAARLVVGQGAWRWSDLLGFHQR